MSQKRDYYEVLGCEREAPAEELRRAYKREALKHHPDRNQGDPKSEAVFKEINEAYQVLSDTEKRQVYDQYGHAGLESGGGGPGAGGMGDVFSHMQDLFSEMFSGGGFGQTRSRRGGDLRVKREVVVHAPTRCDDCSGSGAKPGTKPEACTQCRGTGQVSNARGFVMFTTTCTRCRGQGAVIKHVCKTCEGHGVIEKPRKVNVTFPAGIDGGQRLRVTGQGMPGPAGAPPGDLYVDVDIEDDARFERDGVDVITRVHLGFTDAALGAVVKVSSIESDETTIPLDVPPGTQPGAVFTLKGQGIPRLDGRGRGSLVVAVQVDVPTKLSARAKTLLAELEVELRGETADASASARKTAAK
jgi:molecular chaperone DnaJ